MQVQDQDEAVSEDDLRLIQERETSIRQLEVCRASKKKKRNGSNGIILNNAH